MSRAAREALKSLYSLCDSLDNTPYGIRNQSTDLKTRDVLYVETTQFLMYLSASDGRVKWSEADYIGELFEMNVTPDQLTKMIKDNNIYSTKFESEVPLIIKLFLKADNKLIERGDAPDKPSAVLMADFFEAVGKDFLGCDGDMDSNELKDLKIYMNTIRSYIRSELRSASKKSAPVQNSLKSKYEILKKN